MSIPSPRIFPQCKWGIIQGKTRDCSVIKILGPTRDYGIKGVLQIKASCSLLLRGKLRETLTMHGDIIDDHSNLGG